MIQEFANRWPFSAATVEQLGWVLVHWLWQFALVAALAGLTARAMRRSSATARYGMLVAALAVLVTAPLVTWRLQFEGTAGLARDPGSAPQALAGTGSLPVSLPVARDANGPTSALGLYASDASPEPLPAGSSLPRIGFQRVGAWSGRIRDTLRPWLGWMVAGWGLGVLVCSVRPLLGVYTLWRFQRVGVFAVPDEILESVRRVSARLGLRRAVRVLRSTLAQVPVAAGFVRPVILVPVALITHLPPAHIEAILAHEPGREQVGEVLGKPVLRDEVDGDKVGKLLAPVIEQYTAAHRAEIAPTEDEIRYATEFFDRQHRERLATEGRGADLREQLKTIEARLARTDLSVAERQQLDAKRSGLKVQIEPPGRMFAEFILNGWKFQKHLYDNFGGGRILWQQAGLEAFDAMRTFLEAQEKQGKFKITDARLRAKVYEYWNRDHGAFLTADKERIRREFLEPEWVRKSPTK